MGKLYQVIRQEGGSCRPIANKLSQDQAATLCFNENGFADPGVSYIIMSWEKIEGPPARRPDSITHLFVPASLRDPSHYISVCVYGKKLWVENKCFDSITEIKKAFNINQEGVK